jgi:5'-nucleotidase
LIDGERTGAVLGGWARLASVTDWVRRQRKNVALLHAGDAVQGGLYFMKYGGRPEMELLDRLGFDAMTLGNHEFDKGADFLAGFLKYTRVPILGANVHASGVPKLAERIKPYVTLKYGQERVGVIGLVTADTAFISSPGRGVRFGDVVETARKYVRELEAKGIDKIILLTHIGYGNDKKLAAAVAGVDVIVGGHSHTLLGQEVQCDFGVVGLRSAGPYPTEVRGADGNTVYVVTAWKWSRVLGQLDVSFDDGGRVVTIAPRPLLLVGSSTFSRKAQGRKVRLQPSAMVAAEDWLNSHPPAFPAVRDKKTAAYLAPFTKGVDALHEDVIGVASADIPTIEVPGASPSGLDLPHGSLLAPLVARSMLEKLAGTGRPAEVALQNGGGVRESIPAGKVTVGTAYAVLPFGNTLVSLDVSGDRLRQALEYGVTRSGGAFPYVAGARYTADMIRPEGQHITRVEVRLDGKWRPLDPARTYRLVTNSYLARGGDGYAMLADAPGKEDTGFVDAQAFIEFVRRQKGLAPPAETGVTYVPAK